MKRFPAAVPEIPVSDIDKVLDYYKNMLGFTIDWGGTEGGIAGISKEDCRLFLTNDVFRSHYGNTGSVMIWLNFDSREDVDELHRVWSSAGARIISLPESKPYGLHEFTASDPDGNFIRVFYDFATPKRGT
jgi:predicted lactoylglutathione lyase